MINKERLVAHLKDRQTQLESAKKKGTKIVGYFPGNYVPEELIYAAGAVPICFARGGSSGDPANAALEIMPHIGCPFARTQIGERLTKTNPYYEMVDLFVAPITCQHLKKVAEIWDYYGDMEVFKLGVPHKYDGDIELDYYTGRLHDLKDRLQVLTGNEIANGKLKKAIALYNRMRDIFKALSLTRLQSPPLINALDFAMLNHASFYADPLFMVDFLESVYHDLTLEQKGSVNDDIPRILLVGPNLADGDYDILKLVRDAGAEIVAEEVCEGFRYYRNKVEEKGDLVHSLAKAYLRDKLPCAFMRYSSKKRLDFAFELINDFNISGVIWYELMYCETYDMESYYFSQKMSERNIPMLILESGYGEAGIGQTKIRVDAFIEMVKGGIV